MLALRSVHVGVDDVIRNVNAFFSELFLLTWLPFSVDSSAIVCSAQKVKVAVESAKIGASSHVTNPILENAAEWLVYASTVTYDVTKVNNTNLSLWPLNG